MNLLIKSFLSALKVFSISALVLSALIGLIIFANSLGPTGLLLFIAVMIFLVMWFFAWIDEFIRKTDKI